MGRKGISLVALVITIVVMVILAGTVIMTGMNAPDEAQLAVLDSNIQTVQEVVNLKMSSNTIKHAGERNRKLYKWVGVIPGYTEEMAAAGTNPTMNKKILGSIGVSTLDRELNEKLKMSKEEFEKYVVDIEGNIYYNGYEYKGEVYYGTNIKEPEWVKNIGSNSNLNQTMPRVSEVRGGVLYSAPIPKGFVPSTVEGENKITEGLVIYDTAVSEDNNQFVWVPIDNKYNITNARGQTITGKTALAYWQGNANGTGTEGRGYNEPYPRTAGSWTRTEWDLMYSSVMKYGGFYVGRYETGYETVEGVRQPVVQAGKSVWNSVPWGSSMTEFGSNTATAISRGMYTSEEYGVTSTLIYGIQWDSVMNWANCASKTRATSTYTSRPSPTGAVYADGTTYDVNKNIYDLAGNVREWTMEADDSSYRVGRGGNYGIASAVSTHGHYRISSGITNDIGFRTALYVK